MVAPTTGKAMTDPMEQEFFEFTQTLIHSRQNVSPKRLVAPAPAGELLNTILNSAGAAPDHGQLTPWRFVVVPDSQRKRLADVFAQALVERDPQASELQIANAREKAHRAPFLMLAIARLNHSVDEISAVPGRGGHHPQATEADIHDAERLVSLGCAIQNILLSANAAGFGTGITSGQAMGSRPLRDLFGLTTNEQAVCCVNIGTVTKVKPPRLRPDTATYVTWLDDH
jgi:nitroreductase